MELLIFGLILLVIFHVLIWRKWGWTGLIAFEALGLLFTPIALMFVAYVGAVILSVFLPIFVLLYVIPALFREVIVPAVHGRKEEDDKGDRVINERVGKAEYFYYWACRDSLERNMDRCLRDLTKAIELDPSCGERAQRDDALEWARNHRQVQEILGLA